MREGNDLAGDASILGQDASTEGVPTADAASLGFVGQWNRLISTTNWKKGRIICQWRDAQMAESAPITEYSDEAWAQLVGGVTSQHVGRLRRVSQRFGDVHDQYEGLYWSHFQAALEWDDAEMWLEGAIHSGWSVSQMRGKRWETVGMTGDPPPDEPVEESGDLEDAIAAAVDLSVIDPATTSDEPAESGSARDGGDASSDDGDARRERVDASAEEQLPTSETVAAAPSTPSRSRLAVDVEDLPDDLADAFEQFKLAIIAHRRSQWNATTPAAVIECLDALRELTTAPAD
ncbi:MAG: hypothetical protein AAF961_11075 [Planctomycetota bacterium]